MSAGRAPLLPGRLERVARLIAGADFRPLGIMAAAGGPVLHVLRQGDPALGAAAEIYCSVVEPGALKAWKRHARMTQRMAVPMGRLRFVLYDARADAATRGALAVLDLGRPDAYGMLRIPPGVWYGFRNPGAEPALILNCTDLVHDPAESVRLDPAAPDIPYDWSAEEEA